MLVGTCYLTIIWKFEDGKKQILIILKLELQGWKVCREIAYFMLALVIETVFFKFLLRLQ